MRRAAALTEREERILGIIETARAEAREVPRRARSTWPTAPAARRRQSMIEGLFVPAFGGETLAAMGDAGAVSVDGVELAMTTDSFVVKPLRFPGGSIGDLAVNGTVNDLAVSGARPLALTLSLILEEGLAADDLRPRSRRSRRRPRPRTSRSSPATPRSSSAAPPTRCTSAPPGIGRRDPRARLAPDAIRPGDRILLSGTIGEHGTAIMLARGEFELDAAIESDTRSLWPVADALLEEAGPSLRCMRDATRGGVASVLNELARASQVAMLVGESAVPVDPAVGGRLGDPGDRPDVRGQRGQARRLRRARKRRTARSRRCARSRAASARPRSARCGRSRPGWCWWRRALAASG